MAMRKAGDRWRGEAVEDLVAYLGVEHSGYPIDQVVEARCSRCDGQVFEIELDETSTRALRTCAACGLAFHMLDCAEYWPDGEEAEAQYVVECECGSDEFEAAVGFSFYGDDADSDIRWVSIGVRCTKDGLMGFCADWKIGYGPSRHLLSMV